MGEERKDISVIIGAKRLRWAGHSDGLSRVLHARPYSGQGKRAWGASLRGAQISILLLYTFLHVMFEKGLFMLT